MWQFQGLIKYSPGGLWQLWAPEGEEAVVEAISKRRRRGLEYSRGLEEGVGSPEKII